MRLPERQSQYLDAWRGGSAIAVLIGHSFEVFQVNPSPIWAALANGAVMVFFVLSGFFIRKSLDSSLAKGRPWLFIAARVNRLAVVFAVSILLTVVLWAAAPMAFATGARSFAIPTARPDFSIVGLVPTMLFLNGFFGLPTLSANGPLWSLSCEIWYYALALLLALPRWRVAGLALLIILLVGNHGYFPLLGAVWALGFFLPRLPRWVVLAPVPALAAFLVFPDAGHVLTLWQLAAGVGFAAHVSNLSEQPPRLFIHPSAAWSYTLYVIHFPLLLFAYGSIGVNWAMPFAILAGTALIGPRIEKVKLL